MEFVEGVKVDCLVDSRYCGKCCYNTEMILCMTDIALLTSIGYSLRDFAIYSRGFIRLRNVRGHCLFLDPSTNKCLIYRCRPVGCRLYPLLYDPYKDAVIVDKYCPRYRDVLRRVDLENYISVFKEFYSEALEAARVYRGVLV